MTDEQFLLTRLLLMFVTIQCSAVPYIFYIRKLFSVHTFLIFLLIKFRFTCVFSITLTPKDLRLFINKTPLSFCQFLFEVSLLSQMVFFLFLSLLWYPALWQKKIVFPALFILYLANGLLYYQHVFYFSLLLSFVFIFF